jgi:hypothetical protein
VDEIARIVRRSEPEIERDLEQARQVLRHRVDEAAAAAVRANLS